MTSKAARGNSSIKNISRNGDENGVSSYDCERRTEEERKRLQYEEVYEGPTSRGKRRESALVEMLLASMAPDYVPQVE